MSKKVNISKEDIEKYYIEGLHTVQECTEHFGISKTTFNRYLKKYGIVRSKEDKSKVYSRAQNSEDVKKKVRETNIKKYGAVSKVAASSPIRFIDENAFTVYGKEYSVDWLKEKYLTENVSSAEMCHLLGTTYAVVNKINKHYHTSKNSEQRYELIKQKTIDKYGVASTLQLDAVKEKSRETCLKKYGAENPMKTEEIQAKVKKTVREKYHVENYAQTEEYRKKNIRTSLERYGAPSHMQKEMKHLNVWNEKDKMQDFLSSLSEKPSASELKGFFNLADRTVIYEKIHEWQLENMVSLNPPRSYYEDEIVSLLKGIGVKNIIKNDREVLDGKEIDIYVPDSKIGIEFNGDYWHSDIFYGDHGGRSTAAQEKSLNAEKKGVFLFTIFEREWNDPVVKKSIEDRLRSIFILNKNKIPARKCVFSEVSSLERSEFLNENHIQGNSGAKIGYGLRYNGELVACMTFSRPKSGKYTWELTRYCTKHGITVQGGASKLFKEFIKRNLSTGDTVSSYNDITKTKGNLYKILGFDLISVNSPNYVWINFTTKDIRTRYQEQEAGEVERMHSLGYHRVCDCGTKTWVYTVK